MQPFISYFETLPSHYRTLALVAGLVVFWLLEGAVPLFTFNYRRTQHALLNLLLTFFQLVIAVLLGLLIVKLAAFTTEHHFGLFYLLRLPLALHVLLGILLLDLFGGYLIHRIEHSLDWMWRFHIVHHADTHVDVTTGLRHHPVETLFRLSAQAAAVYVGGIPIGIVFLYQIVSVFFAQLTHANIRTPSRLDRWLSLVFVTPNMHKVHHHHSMPLTDTNYGNVFSIWDRLFGTFRQVDSRQLKYGIDSLAVPEDAERLTRMLAIPFSRKSR